VSKPQRSEPELNEPPASDADETIHQHLLNASNELYLYRLQCEEAGWTVPEPLVRAHQAIRAEVRRRERGR
jgi:hypothetical protein